MLTRSLRSLRSLMIGAAFLLAQLGGANARVVINEIFYNAPDDIEDLEYIELHNAGEQAVDLSGWAFRKGIRYTFPQGSRLEARGFLVLCRNSERFKEYYSCPIAGTFPQHLSNKGERLELVDPSGHVLDSVKYQDSPPWPAGANGASGSLERICPDAAGEDPFNWASSPLSKDRLKPAGTPGAVNANYSAQLPPAITAVNVTPQFPAPLEPIRVEASVRAPGGVAEVRLRYQVAGPGYERAEASLALTQNGDGHYAGSIPGQAAGQLVRVRIEAIHAGGARRLFPSPHEPRPALSAYVHQPSEPARLPFAWLVHTSETEFKTAQEKAAQTEAGGAARGSFGPGVWVAAPALAQGDKNGDRKLSAAEFAGLAEAWFSRLDPDGAGKLTRDEFSESLGEILPAADAKQGAAARARGGQRGGGARAGERGAPAPGGGLALAPPWFVALDANQDGSLTRDEWKAGFARSFSHWDASKAGQLDERALALGWSEVLLGRKLTDAERTALGAAVPREKFKAPSRGLSSSRSALIYFDARQGGLRLFDFIQVTPRAHGYKVHLSREAMLDEMTTLNLQFENERAALAEPLAYEVYRRAGVPAPRSHHVRLWVDGRPLGYHLLVEQPNRAFLRRHQLPDDGNLYKLLAEESGVVGQHEKRTHTRQGHDDIVALVAQLSRRKGSELSSFIQENFELDEVVNYFAVCMALSNWDGFYNNYLAYHAPGENAKSGKWSIYPWDQEQTWGIINAAPDEIFCSLPLTFGMEGDAAPAAGARPSDWWHPGGYFSRPLLAEPSVRQRFLSRTREIVETIYTEQQFGPVMDELGERLRPEIAWRAGQRQEDPATALARFEQELQRCREHLRQRREFLLSQAELQNAPKAPPTPALATEQPAPTPKTKPGARKKTKAPQ